VPRDINSSNIKTFPNMDSPYVLRTGQITVGISGLENKSYSVTATVPTQLIATDLDMYQQFGPKLSNTTASIDFIRPVVTVQCINPIPRRALVSPIPYIKGDGSSQGSVPSFSELVRSYMSDGGLNETRIDSLPPFWVSSPDSESISIIGVFSYYIGVDTPCTEFNISRSSTPSLLENPAGVFSQCIDMSSCTISAFWETSKFEMVSNQGSYSVQTDPITEAGVGRRIHQTPIMINLGGVPAFNTAKINGRSGIYRIDSTVAVAFATALSEIPPWDKYHLRVGSEKPYSRFKFETTQYGYGYGTFTTSVRLSICVITTYCIITISYIVYILATGSTSTAWNSAIELIVLAFQSKQPRHLGHTSVGIDSIKTYREAVGIRVNDRNELELVFAHEQDTDKRGLTHVVPNQSY